MFAPSEVKWRESKWEVGEPRLSTGTQWWAVHFNWGLSKHSAIPLNGPLWWMTGTNVVYFSSQEEPLCERQCVWTQKARPAKVPAPLSFIDSWHCMLRESVREKMSYLGTHLRCIWRWVYVRMCVLFVSVTRICPPKLTNVHLHRQEFTFQQYCCKPCWTHQLLFQNSCGDPKLSKESKSVRLNLGEMCKKWCKRHLEHFKLMEQCSHKKYDVSALNISVSLCLSCFA